MTSSLLFEWQMLARSDASSSSSSIVYVREITFCEKKKSVRTIAHEQAARGIRKGSAHVVFRGETSSSSTGVAPPSIRFVHRLIANHFVCAALCCASLPIFSSLTTTQYKWSGWLTVEKRGEEVGCSKSFILYCSVARHRP